MFNVLTGEYENWLAEDWSYNDDFTEITMTLREGIEWSDGTPFTADDVVFTFNSVRDKQSEATNAAEIVFLKEAVADDPLTVRFVLTEANPRWWATTLTSNHGVVEQLLPKHIWEGQDLLTFANYDPEQGWPVGTGPYTLVSTTSQQKIFDLRQDWWGAKTGWKALPKVERVIYLPTSDDTLSAQQLITNEVDMGKILSVPTLQTVIAQNPEVMTFSGTNPPYGYLDWCPIDLNFNCSAAPWDNAQLRWAISNALDRTALVALAEGGAGVVALHQFTPYEWFTPFEETLQPIFAQYDLDTDPHPEKVEELMTGLGYAKNGDGMWELDGETLEMAIFVPDWLRAYGPPLTQQLRDAGFDASFDTSPGLEHTDADRRAVAVVRLQGAGRREGHGSVFHALDLYVRVLPPHRGTRPDLVGHLALAERGVRRRRAPDRTPLSADAPETMELFNQAMEIWVRELPDVYVAQLIIRYPMSTHYWTGWPTEADPYGFPHSWQQEFLKTILRLEPTS